MGKSLRFASALGINVISFDIFDIDYSYNENFGYNYIGRNGKVNISQDITLLYLKIEHSFQTRGLEMEYLPLSNKYDLDISLNFIPSIDFWAENGDFDFSLGLGSFFSISLSVIGNIYYQHQ